MTKSLLGLGFLLLGLLIAWYSEPLARAATSINKHISGLVLPIKWGRTMNLIAGILWAIYGLLLTFHLAPLPR